MDMGSKIASVRLKTTVTVLFPTVFTSTEIDTSTETAVRILPFTTFETVQKTVEIAVSTVPTPVVLEGSGIPI